MPQVGWFEALKIWNAGSPSWCIPRKGTLAYNSIMKIQKGEPVQTPKELIDKLERKTTGKGKKEKKEMKIKI